MRRDREYPAKHLAAFALLVATSLAHAATYLDDVGHAALATELGAGIPDGAGVTVMQVEASTSGDKNNPIWSPSTTVSGTGSFAGKTFSFIPGSPTATSSHAIGVADLFYGAGAMADGVTNVVAANAGTVFATPLAASIYLGSTPARVVNNSWVGFATSVTSADNVEFLRAVDNVVNATSQVQVVGLTNGSAGQPLLGNAFNVIAVGRTDGQHPQGSVALVGASAYASVRTRPDVVAPMSTTSAATPVVSAAAALLVETGHTGGATLDNAERAETVKAALMAGADRHTNNGSTSANITDYRASGFQSANGLDTRFGAGQVNVLTSYHIIAGGEHGPGDIGCGTVIGSCAGFDYEGTFGGANGTEKFNDYTFTATDAQNMLTATLAWNLDVSSDLTSETLHHLGLSLFDTTAGGTLVSTSASLLDNTQNLWLGLITGHDYTLQVFSLESADFNRGYALAWNIAAAPVPLPAAVWLMASVLLGMVTFSRRRSR
jgi:hypothetical protein